MGYYNLSDMISSASRIIQHPVDVVWPHLLDTPAWMKDFKIETVAGRKNEEGELKRATPLLPEAKHFFFKTLLLIPFQKFVYKAYTDDRTGAYGFTGVEALSLNGLGKHSAVSLEVYLEFQSELKSPEELSAFVADVKKGSVALWERNFDRLTSLVEASTNGK